MDSKAILARAKVLVRESESDALARAALAVQQSECGAARRVEAIIASLNDLPVPRVAPLDVNAVRAIVLRETGLVIELDDPFLLMLAATQDLGLSRLEETVALIRRKGLGRLLEAVVEELSLAVENDWLRYLLVYAAGMLTAFALLPPLARWVH